MSSSSVQDIDELRLITGLARVFSDATSTLSAAAAILGAKLGLYALIAGESEGIDAESLAARTRLDYRFLVAWLTHQEESAILIRGDDGRYKMPLEARVMFAGESGAAEDALAPLMASVALCAEVPKILDALSVGKPLRDQDLAESTRDAFHRLSSVRASRWLDEWLEIAEGLEQALERGARLLDLGGGEGELVSRLAKRFPGSEFRLMDPLHSGSPSHWPPNLSTISREIESVRESFDVVLSVETFHHFSQPVDVARKVRHLLEEGGRWLVVELADGPATRGILRRHASAVAALYCTPQLIGTEAVGAGALIGTDTVLELMRTAGFHHSTVLGETMQHVVIEGRR